LDTIVKQNIPAESIPECNKSEADKENKKEDLQNGEESSRSKIVSEEVKVLESMENMETSELAGRIMCTEEIGRPSSSTAEMQAN
jgi:hypothetical protein